LRSATFIARIAAQAFGRNYVVASNHRKSSEDKKTDKQQETGFLENMQSLPGALRRYLPRLVLAHQSNTGTREKLTYKPDNRPVAN
jgi:hypothetical protein